VHELAEIASDPDAFERFYREHVEAVQRFVARRVDDPYLAADLTADVFVAAIGSAGSYRAGASRRRGCSASPATSSPGSGAGTRRSCGLRRASAGASSSTRTI
jgi:RNA polymerase sigma-70 factor (ECF subfamily)